MRWPFFLSPAEPAVPCAYDRLLSRRRRLQRRGWLSRFSCVALLCAVPFAHATSVTPPTFHELVAEAQVIAEGTVTGVESRWVDAPEGHVIKTFVTFAVTQRLKGESADPVTLQFLGGTVGADTLHVSGMPEFKVGKREILFIQGNGVQFCPLVRFSHGRYRVRTDAQSQRRYVARNDGRPLHAVSDVQLPAEHRAALAPSTPADGMSPSDFESQIRAELNR